MSTRASTPPLRVLAVDDERPALDELAYLLRHDERIGEIATCDSATEALRVLREREVDAVFLDVQMPGLTGLELAGVLANFRTPPAVVFVTAHDEHAVDAFGLDAVDYVLKPVRAERLADAVRRVLEQRGRADAPAPDEQVAVELGGVTRFVARSRIVWVEAQGDYARLHTGDASHLLRVPLHTLEEQWGPHGFARIHRSLLVNVAHVSEVRTVEGRCVVRLGHDGGEAELVVSRRHTRAFRELLARGLR